ncbi:MAG: molybdate ABC transporter substrate-binding protein [Myxococcota bacterium]|jgi:molybdate transport system substrate-binding protein|nr:molybdate ABC transporter substrate-binding protein [Myxococcota bacterium]
MSLRATIIALVLLVLPARLSGAEEIIVAAAASLREPVQELAASFAQKYPEHEIRTAFGSSSTLARQIRLGAPIDVFISADERWVVDLVERGLVADGAHFPLAGNRLVILARPGFEARIQEPKDLLSPALKRFALPSAAVPLGAYAREWLEANAMLEPLENRLITTEHAKATLFAVEGGHADAALIYASDARYATEAAVVLEIPSSEQPTIIYSAARLQRSHASAAATRFMAVLGGPRVGQTLAAAGFVPLAQPTGRPPP